MSGFFNIGLEKLLLRQIAEEAEVWALGVNDDYVFNSGQTALDLLEEFTILPPQQLTSVTGVDGYLDADDTQWIAAGADPAPEDNLELQGVVIFFLEPGDITTLLAFISGPAVGLPQTLTGVNVTAKWNAQGILKI